MEHFIDFSSNFGELFCRHRTSIEIYPRFIFFNHDLFTLLITHVISPTYIIDIATDFPHLILYLWWTNRLRMLDFKVWRCGMIHRRWQELELLIRMQTSAKNQCHPMQRVFKWSSAFCIPIACVFCFRWQIRFAALEIVWVWHGDRTACWLRHFCARKFEWLVCFCRSVAFILWQLLTHPSVRALSAHNEWHRHGPMLTASPE